MSLALSQAWSVKGKTLPNPPVGAVLVRDDVVLATGATSPVGGPHAEVMAIESARKAGHDPKGATLYCTLEPCNHYGRTPPCTKAITEAGIEKVVVACKDHNIQVAGQGFEKLRENGIDVMTGVLKKTCNDFYAGYFYATIHKRPQITVKIAQSRNWTTSEQIGVRSAITGEESHREVMRLRGFYDAILVGGNTVRIDNPTLRAVVDGQDYQPHIIVLTKQTVWDKKLELFSKANKERVTLLNPLTDLTQTETIYSPEQLSKLSSSELIKVIVDELGHRGFHSVWVEPGPSMAADWVASGLIHQLYLLTAAHEYPEGPKWASTLPRRWESAFEFRKLPTLENDQWQVATTRSK